MDWEEGCVEGGLLGFDCGEFCLEVVAKEVGREEGECAIGFGLTECRVVFAIRDTVLVLLVCVFAHLVVI